VCFTSIQQLIYTTVDIYSPFTEVRNLQKCVLKSYGALSYLQLVDALLEEDKVKFKEKSELTFASVCGTQWDEGRVSRNPINRVLMNDASVFQKKIILKSSGDVASEYS